MSQQYSDSWLPLERVRSHRLQVKPRLSPIVIAILWLAHFCASSHRKLYISKLNTLKLIAALKRICFIINWRLSCWKISSMRFSGLVMCWFSALTMVFKNYQHKSVLEAIGLMMTLMDRIVAIESIESQPFINYIKGRMKLQLIEWFLAKIRSNFTENCNEFT